MKDRIKKAIEQLEPSEERLERNLDRILKRMDEVEMAVDRTYKPESAGAFRVPGYAKRAAACLLMVVMILMIGRVGSTDMGPDRQTDHESYARDIQMLLNYCTPYSVHQGIVADGIYGPKTEAAVKRYAHYVGEPVTIDPGEAFVISTGLSGSESEDWEEIVISFDR